MAKKKKFFSQETTSNFFKDMNATPSSTKEKNRPGSPPNIASSSEFPSPSSCRSSPSDASPGSELNRPDEGTIFEVLLNSALLVEAPVSLKVADANGQLESTFEES